MENAKQNARLSLACASYNPKTLALLHTAVATAASLVISLLGYLLDQGIAGTGGLSGMGLRAMLSTVQSLLMLSVTALMPFWELGFVYAGLGYARQEGVSPATLTMGFRRFLPALRLLLIEALLTMGVVMACTYGSYILFMFTPLFGDIVTILEPVMDMGGSVLDYAAVDALIPQLLPKLVPLYILMGLVFLVLGVPVLYRYRMARFIHADGENSALKCIVLSAHMMRHRRLSLLRVDLSLWWYYLLQALLTVLSLGDSLLALAGIALPISDTVLFWLFYGIYMALRLVISWKCLAFVQTTYAHCYEACRQYAQPLPNATKNP